jgi:hypothetical protein
MWLVNQMLIQFFGGCLQVDRVVSAPKIQEVATLFATKAMKQLSVSMNGEFTVLA